MNQPQESKICPECQADCAVDAQRCWMCHADLSRAETVLTAELVPARRDVVSETFFAIATLLLVGVALLIGIGLAAEEIGLAIVYAIVAAPALIATVIRIQYRKAKVGHVSWAERFLTLIISASAVMAIFVLLVAASIAALFVACLVNGPPSFH